MAEELKTEFDYTLLRPFSYGSKGNLVEESMFITLKAPTSRNMKECLFLKQAFYRSMPEPDPKAVAKARKAKEEAELAGETNNEVTDDAITGEEMMVFIGMSKEVDLLNVLIASRTLFCSGLAMVDGEEKLTLKLVEEMSIDDLEAMTGEYMANFILASSMAKMKGL